MDETIQKLWILRKTVTFTSIVWEVADTLDPEEFDNAIRSDGEATEIDWSDHEREPVTKIAQLREIGCDNTTIPFGGDERHLDDPLTVVELFRLTGGGR